MPETREELYQLLENAYGDIRAAALVADNDPARPKYHFRAPGQWMDDPNGSIYHKGYYHMMYCLNPNSSTQRAGMVYKTAIRVWDPNSEDWTGGVGVWGHARSKDLLHWEHLPIAIYPSIDRGEHFIWFGCTRINDDGVPIAFYTSVGPDKRPEDTADQWAAIGDDDMIKWEKVDCNPVLDYGANGDVTIGEWRDPFVFRENGKAYMILGGTLPKDKEGYPVISLYEAQNSAFTQWKFKGILFRYHDKTVPSIECPNITRIGDKWMIVISPHREVEYYIGEVDFDACTFTEERRAVMDFSTDYYATNILHDDKGRTLMWGSVVGVFEKTSGWNCCLALPKEVSLGDGNVLKQKPVEEMKQLRGAHTHFADTVSSDTVRIARNDTGTFELVIRVETDSTAGVVLNYYGNRVELVCDGAFFRIADRLVPRKQDGTPDVIHAFVDRSLIDVYINETDCVTRIIKTCTDSCDICVVAGGGSSQVEVDVWDLEADNLFTLSDGFQNGKLAL